jgi:hypothetical protein
MAFEDSPSVIWIKFSVHSKIRKYGSIREKKVWRKHTHSGIKTHANELNKYSTGKFGLDR